MKKLYLITFLLTSFYTFSSSAGPTGEKVFDPLVNSYLTVVELSNNNDFRVLVEWATVGGSGYADIPAKTIVTDQYYAYGTTQCGAEIRSATRG